MHLAEMSSTSSLDELEPAIFVRHLTGTELLLTTITIRFHPPRVQNDGQHGAQQTGAQRQTGRLEVLVMRDPHRLVALQSRIELTNAKDPDSNDYVEIQIKTITQPKRRNWQPVLFIYHSATVSMDERIRCLLQIFGTQSRFVGRLGLQIGPFRGTLLVGHDVYVIRRSHQNCVGTSGVERGSG